MPGFRDFNLVAPLQKAIAEEGYATPTPIQEHTIPAAVEGQDVLGIAQTGTGKTAAFALPILDHFARQNSKAVPKRPMALVLAPTRELAIQIADSFDTYGRHLPVRNTVIYGGVGQGRQVAATDSGVHILVATPGRLLDLMGQELIFLNRLQIFVLDEADRMMDMGFLPDLRRIIKVLPIRRQSLFFSATMPPKIEQLAAKLLHDPFTVDVAPKKTNVELIDQRVIFADHGQKKPLLVKLLNAGDVGQAIVFTKTKPRSEFRRRVSL
ncbi:MAG: DEAD/DEAH box helicase [Planctomycetaceae bacterium]